MTTMKVELPEIRPEERTPLVEALLAVLRQVLDHVGELEATNQQLRDEVAVLKGQKPRPQLRPSTLTLPAATGAGTSGPGRRRGKPSQPKTSQLTIHREVPLHPAHLPEGAMFKGYEAYVVQDLVIQSDNTKYLRARYDLPEGGSVLAPLPAGVLPVAGGHFGANLVVYILDQYHHAQVTEPLLLQQLWEYGIVISAGQLHRLLTEGHAPLHQEKADVLAAGLAVSSYVGTDDTGARHRGHNGYCTAVGNDLFACFESSASKSRLNFLQVLHGPQRDYALNETAQAYWERQKLPAAVQAALLQGPQAFAGEQAWNTRLAALAIIDERHVRIVTEGALLGGCRAAVGQTGAAQRGTPGRHRRRPPPDLGAVPGLEGLSGAAPARPATGAGGPFRRPGEPADRLSEHQRRAEGDARPQGRPVTGVGAAGGTAAQQRPGVGHPGIREAPQDQRRHAQRGGPSLPRHLCQLEKDLPQAGGALLGLSARSGAGAGPSAPPGGPDPPERARGSSCTRRGRARLTERRRARPKA